MSMVFPSRKAECFLKAGSDCARDFCAEQGEEAAGAYPLGYGTAWHATVLRKKIKQAQLVLWNIGVKSCC